MGQSLRRGLWVVFMRRTYALSSHPLILIIYEIDSTSLIGLGSRLHIYCVRPRARACRAASEPGDKSRPECEAWSRIAQPGPCTGNRSSHRCIADVAPQGSPCLNSFWDCKRCRRVNPTTALDSGLTREVMRSQDLGGALNRTPGPFPRYPLEREADFNLSQVRGHSVPESWQAPPRRRSVHVSSRT